MFTRTCVLLFSLAVTGLGQVNETKKASEQKATVASSSQSDPKESAPTANPSPVPNQRYEYRLLATNKTSTMQKEMNEAADAGFRFEGTMGGETAFGGSEVVVVMSKDPLAELKPGYDYKLLATKKTSTMQKELQEAGDAGFEYLGQTVFSKLFGKDVVAILGRNPESKPQRWEYNLLATSKTKTMQKELSEAGDAGFTFVGVTVGETAFGGNEIISILRRPVRE